MIPTLLGTCHYHYVHFESLNVYFTKITFTFVLDHQVIALILCWSCHILTFSENIFFIRRNLIHKHINATKLVTELTLDFFLIFHIFPFFYLINSFQYIFLLFFFCLLFVFCVCVSVWFFVFFCVFFLMFSFWYSIAICLA